MAENLGIRVLLRTSFTNWSTCWVVLTEQKIVPLHSKLVVIIMTRTTINSINTDDTILNVNTNEHDDATRDEFNLRCFWMAKDNTCKYATSSTGTLLRCRTHEDWVPWLYCWTPVSHDSMSSDRHPTKKAVSHLHRQLHGEPGLSTGGHDNRFCKKTTNRPDISNKWLEAHVSR